MNIENVKRLAQAFRTNELRIGFNIKSLHWNNRLALIGKQVDYSGRAIEQQADIVGWTFTLATGKMVTAVDGDYLHFYKTYRIATQWLGLDVITANNLFNQANHPKIGKWNVGFTLADWWGDLTTSEVADVLDELALTGEVKWTR